MEWILRRFFCKRKHADSSLLLSGRSQQSRALKTPGPREAFHNCLPQRIL